MRQDVRQTSGPPALAVACGCFLGLISAVPLSVQAQESDAPPPLVVDEDAPLLLEDVEVEALPEEAKKTMAQNQACFVCHENYRAESLVRWHAAASIGCVQCHGESDAHKNDGNNVTPPDLMFATEDIRASCRYCHPWHHALPQQLITVYMERYSTKPLPDTIRCTDCHGEHQLPVRNVVWDKKTRKLIYKRPKMDQDRPTAPDQDQAGSP